MKAAEAPKKLKKYFRHLVKRLDKTGIKLDPNGEIDWSEVDPKHFGRWAPKKEIIKMALKMRDLEFEFPQKLEKMKLKSSMIELLDQEEAKLELAKKKYDKSMEGQPEKEVQRDPVYLWDHDLLESKFENPDERAHRIHKEWIQLKRANVLENPDKRTTEEQVDLQNEIVDKIRDLRWRVDQELVRRKLDPIFKFNYHRYTKSMFMFDSDIEFSKLKTFLDRNPRILQEDPLVGTEYKKIMELLRRKRIVETTTNKYEPGSHYFHQQHMKDKPKR